MNDLQRRLSDLLERTAVELRESRLPGEFAKQLERLGGQVEQPCEVAVVGRVKAGKSTFINAFLGAEDELARVGATETTATINYFRYGTPDPERPVRCHWRNGASEEVTREFLDSLQGNDLDTLRRADGIDHLEYFLPNPLLKEVVLVDTPGLGAAVDTHQDRTAEYMQLYRQLRQRHDRETQELDSKADAVIYLTDAVTRVTDRDFLEDFGQVTQGRSKAVNAVGVVARIDQQPEVMDRRHQLASKIASQLESHLNTVVPVSGGLEFALHRLCSNDREGLKRMATALSRVPLETLEPMLASEELYLIKSCPLGAEEREELLDDAIPWTVFTLIARRVAVPDVDLQAVESELTDLAGFQPLKEKLERQFFRRASYLRCFRIVNDARALLRRIRITELPKLRRRDLEEQSQRHRFLDFVREVGNGRDVAQELEEFIRRVVGVAQRGDRLDADLRKWSREFDRLFHDLEEHNADFEVLQELERNEVRFSDEELGELRPLFGLYGFESEKRLGGVCTSIDQIKDRQEAWRRQAIEERNASRKQVAERAATRYGLILEELGDER